MISPQSTDSGKGVRTYPRHLLDKNMERHITIESHAPMPLLGRWPDRLAVFNTQPGAAGDCSSSAEDGTERGGGQSGDGRMASTAIAEPRSSST